MTKKSLKNAFFQNDFCCFFAPAIRKITKFDDKKQKYVFAKNTFFFCVKLIQ